MTTSGQPSHVKFDETRDFHAHRDREETHGRARITLPIKIQISYQNYRSFRHLIGAYLRLGGNEISRAKFVRLSSIVEADGRRAPSDDGVASTTCFNLILLITLQYLES